jgi:hypothetical protein
LNETFPNAVLSDMHRIASYVGATVTVLSNLRNAKSRACTAGTRHGRALAAAAPNAVLCQGRLTVR